jgi:hypothetical protein
MRRFKNSLLLGTILVLWLIGVVFLGDLVSLGAVLSVPGLWAIGLASWEMQKGKYGAVAPWACIALSLLGILLIFALTNVHLHEFTGGASDCENETCSPQPLKGLAHSASLLAFIACATAILRLMRIWVVRSRLPQSESPAG